MYEYMILMMLKIIKQGCFQDYFNKHSKVKHCFKINTRLLQQTSIASRFIQDQLLPQNTLSPTYQGTGNQLLEDKFANQLLKRVWNLNFESCNRLPLMCNRLPATELLKFNLKSHNPSKYNCVIDYHKPVIDYQRRNFRKSILKRHISSNHFEKARRVYIYVSYFEKQERDILKELHCQMLSQQLLDKHLQIC